MTMITLLGSCLILATAAQTEVLHPKPRVHHSFDFERALDGWQACGKGIAQVQQETTYRASHGALQLSWDTEDPKDGWVERSIDLTLSPNTWLSLFYRADGARCGSFAIRLLTPDGTPFTCTGFPAPDSPWRHALIRISFDWWAREFCFAGPKGTAPPPGTRIARLQIGASPLKGADRGARSLYLDDVVLFDAFGADDIRSLFNPRGVIRPPRPCPIAFQFPEDLKHPYLISSPEALRKQTAAYKADPEGGTVRAAFETNTLNSVKLWIAQFLGKLKAPAEVQTPQDAEKAFREKDTEEGFDEILNPEPPPPTELTEKDWQEFFDKPFQPAPSDPRYLEERANICPKCALALPFDPLRPTWHQCPRCRQRFVGLAYDNVWTIQMQRRDAGTAYAAAYAYRISGDERWGRVARKIALGYCDALESDRRFQIGTRGASGLSLQPSAMIPILDLLADTAALSPEEQERVRDNFVTRSIRAGSLFDPTPPGPIQPPAQGWFRYPRRLVDNQVGHALKEMMWIGLAARSEDYIRLILDSYDEALYNGLNEEGVWWEKSIDYQLYFRKGLIMLGGLAERTGLRLYTHTAANGNCFRRIYDAELKIVLPDNQLPSLNDGGRVGFSWAEAYQFYGDRKYHRAGDDLVPLPSANLPVTGWCALRSDAPRAEDQTYVMLDYGTGSGAHAHPDTMQIILYARRKYVSPDLGVASYHASGYWTWYKNPKSHNTMTPLPAAGTTLYFEHSPRLKIIDVETPREAPLRHRRTVAIVRDQYVVDLFRADSDQEQPYTWRYHNIGTLETRQELLASGLPWHQAYWDLRDNQALRLSLLARPETGFAAQTGLGFRPTETLFYVAAQRKSKCFLAPAVIEPFIDITDDPRKVKLEDQVKAVRIGPEKPGPGLDGPADGEDPLEEHIQQEEAGPRKPGAPAPLPYQIAHQKKLAALPVETREGQAAFSVGSEDGTEDICLCPYDRERPWDVAGVQLAGEIAFVLTDRGRPIDLLLLRGRRLSAKGWHMESSAPGSAHLYSIPEGYRIHVVPTTASQWTARLEGSRLAALLRIAADGSQQPSEARIANDSVQWEVTEESDYLLKAASP